MPLFKGTAGKAKPKKAIDYITDPKKAVIVSSLSLDDSADYAKQFKETCTLYGKGNGFNERKYYHFKLSPDRADNATPQQVKQDFDTAQNHNADTLKDILESVQNASRDFATKVAAFDTKLESAFKRSKSILDSHTKNYRQSINKLFSADGWRHVFFWMGIWSSIAMPILLLLNLIFRF